MSHSTGGGFYADRTYFGARLGRATTLPSLCHGPHVGPHNRCTHATPLPTGYRRCAGDPACPVRLPVRGPQLCPGHVDLAAVQHRQTEALMVAVGRG